jgi:hypothetical protein
MEKQIQVKFLNTGDPLLLSNITDHDQHQSYFELKVLTGPDPNTGVAALFTQKEFGNFILTCLRMMQGVLPPA